MRRFISLFTLLLFVFSCSLLEDDSVPELDSAEFYETGNPDYPVLAVDETQTLFGFSQTLDHLYVKHPNNDEWFIELDENYLPESMYVVKGNTEFLLVYSEFDGDVASVAVINQESLETEYFYKIDFPGISKVKSSIIALNMLKSGTDCTEDGIMGWWDNYGEAVTKMVGPVLGGIGCGISAITAVGSGGIATPIAILSCGSFASSIAGDIVGESSDTGGALFKGGSVVGKYGEMILKCTSANWGVCALGVAGEIGAVYNLFKYGTSRSDVATAMSQLDAFVKTGGLAGTWESEELTVSGTTNQAEYYFGLHAGVFTQKSKQTAGNATSEIHLSLQFTFETESNNSLAMTFKRVTINAITTANGQTNYQELGPYSWNEFVSLPQYSAMSAHSTETTTINYKLHENATKLELDGEVFTRK